LGGEDGGWDGGVLWLTGVDISVLCWELVGDEGFICVLLIFVAGCG